MVKDVRWDIEPHTLAKHEILKKYLNAWIPILTKNNKRVIFIDGFAGPGEYKGGELGSPVLVLNTALKSNIDKNTEVIFIFIEDKKKRCCFLENKLKDIKLPDNIKYECVYGHFSEEITKILDDLDQKEKKIAPTFVFIDPFGIKDVPFDVIKRIMKNDKCEILITFMCRDVNRFKSLTQNEDINNKLFGTEEWKNTKDIPELYKRQLEKIAKYVISFKMINKHNQNNYILFFGTNHIRGLEKMKDSMWKVDPKGDFQFSSFDYDPKQTVLIQQKPNFSILKNMIIKEYAGKLVSIEELELFVSTKTFFKKSHFKTSILKPLEKDGKINVEYDGKRNVGQYPPNTKIKFL